MVTNGRTDESHGVNPTRTPGSTVPGVTRKGNNSVSFVYIYEDHDYPTQEAAHDILRSVSEVKICRPGTHNWRKLTTDGSGPDICDICRLVREENPKLIERLWVVFYKNHPTFDEDDQPLNTQDFTDNWTIVKSIMATGPDDVFMKMQGENWSPNGEARGLIRALGLRHTSMSVGDICLDVERSFFYSTLDVGFGVRSKFGDELKTSSPAVEMSEEEAVALCEPCDGDWGKPEKDCRDCIQNSYREAIDEDDDPEEF